MPAKSKQQYKLMQAALHDPELRKKLGMKKKVAEDYVKHTSSPKSLPKYKK